MTLVCLAALIAINFDLNLRRCCSCSMTELLLAPLQRRERVRETSSVTQTANTVTVAFPCKWRPVWPRWVQRCTYWTLLCPHLDGLIHHFFLLQSSQFIHWWTLCFWPRIVDDQWCSAEAECAHCQCVLTLKWCKIYSEKAATVDGRQWDCWPLPDEYVLCMAMSTTRESRPLWLMSLSAPLWPATEWAGATHSLAITANLCKSSGILSVGLSEHSSAAVLITSQVRRSIG